MNTYLNKNKKIILVSFLLILSGIFLFLTGAQSESSGKQKETFYTFQYRDIYFDITYINKQKAVIVGSHGLVLVSHSKSPQLWSQRDSKTTETLTCISFPDEKYGWAAGHGGVVINTTDGGETWAVQRESSPDNQPLFDIKFVSHYIGYACGPYETLLKSADGGKTWMKLSTGMECNYNSLDFYNENVGFAAGEFGTIFKTVDGGISWRRLYGGGNKGSMFGINILPAGKVLAYGTSGKILISWDGGETWINVLYPGASEPLFKAAFSGNDIAIAGKTGTILLSNNGGRSFAVKLDADLTSFTGVCSHPDGGFMFVGEYGKILKVETLKNEKK